MDGVPFDGEEKKYLNGDREGREAGAVCLVCIQRELLVV